MLPLRGYFSKCLLKAKYLVISELCVSERLEARLEQFLSELGELQKRKHRKEILINGENIKNEMLKVCM